MYPCCCRALQASRLIERWSGLEVGPCKVRQLLLRLAARYRAATSPAAVISMAPRPLPWVRFGHAGGSHVHTEEGKHAEGTAASARQPSRGDAGCANPLSVPISDNSSGTPSPPATKLLHWLDLPDYMLPASALAEPATKSFRAAPEPQTHQHDDDANPTSSSDGSTPAPNTRDSATNSDAAARAPEVVDPVPSWMDAKSLRFDPSTVQGYRLASLCQQVIDTLMLVVGGPLEVPDALEAMCRGRLLPTTWLNKVRSSSICHCKQAATERFAGVEWVLHTPEHDATVPGLSFCCIQCCINACMESQQTYSHLCAQYHWQDALLLGDVPYTYMVEYSQDEARFPELFAKQVGHSDAPLAIIRRSSMIAPHYLSCNHIFTPDNAACGSY